MLLHEASASYKTLNDQLSNDIPSQVAAIKFYFVLAGRAYFLLAPKETKVPARNFSVKVSGLALLGNYGKNCLNIYENIFCILDHCCPLLSCRSMRHP